MSANALLPPTTTNAAATQQEQGGIKPPIITIPSIPLVASGGDNYNARMAATQALMKTGNGNLAGGGYRRRRNNVTKVMKGCNNKKTKRHNKKKRHGKRIFRGGNNITPAVTSGGQIELTMPGGSSPTQIETLRTLTGELGAAQTAAANVAPSVPVLATSNFLKGGGVSRRRHRNTKYRRLRYKKSIGRKSRSHRRSCRR
jgi:hypothetical protein